MAKSDINLSEFCAFLNTNWEKDYPPLQRYYIEESVFDEDKSYVVCDDSHGGYSPAPGITHAKPTQLQGILCDEKMTESKDLVKEFRKWKENIDWEYVSVKVSRAKMPEFLELVKKFSVDV